MLRWLAARRALIFIVVGLALAAGALGVYVLRTQAATPTQPIAFSHQAMVQMGIGCLYCHAEARRSPAAGMPSVEKCMGCHRTIDTSNPEVQKVAAYWEQGKPIPWVRVNVLPRFVYFSHQVHVNAGLNCETCHGDVGHMTVDRPVVQMNMGWCLHCHEQQSNAAQLVECVVCHQ
jgi:hypothetical protein